MGGELGFASAGGAVVSGEFGDGGFTGEIRMSFVKKIVRLTFAITSRKAADELIHDELTKTLAVGARLGAERCAQSMKVPKILGVDEDMREWNFYQILEHNVIVNHRITGVVQLLAGNGPALEPGFDVKKDVMPQLEAGEEQVAAFEQSVTSHLDAAARLPKLRGTERTDHVIFGPFDAHRWHCMFGFHLQIHRKQAEALEAEIEK